MTSCSHIAVMHQVIVPDPSKRAPDPFKPHSPGPIRFLGQNEVTITGWQEQDACALAPTAHLCLSCSSQAWVRPQNWTGLGVFPCTGSCFFHHPKYQLLLLMVECSHWIPAAIGLQRHDYVYQGLLCATSWETTQFLPTYAITIFPSGRETESCKLSLPHPCSAKLIGDCYYQGSIWK